jgi:hypothetical protein
MNLGETNPTKGDPRIADKQLQKVKILLSRGLTNEEVCEVLNSADLVVVLLDYDRRIQSTTTGFADNFPFEGGSYRGEIRTAYPMEAASLRGPTVSAMKGLLKWGRSQGKALALS